MVGRREAERKMVTGGRKSLRTPYNPLRNLSAELLRKLLRDVPVDKGKCEHDDEGCGRNGKRAMAEGKREKLGQPTDQVS
jgi:hypothetical protein